MKLPFWFVRAPGATSAVLVLALAAGCGDDGGDDDDDDDDDDIVAIDAGDDAAEPEIDGGGPEIDGGEPEIDAGEPEIDGGPVAACAEPAGTSSGTVAGTVMDQVRSAWTAELFGSGYHGIVVDENGGLCFEAGDPGGEPPDDGYQSLVMFTFGPPAVGTYAIVPFSEKDLGADEAGALLEDSPDGGDVDDGVSGTLTIDSVDDCVSGSYAVEFAGGGTLSGTFNALACPATDPA